MLGYGCSDCRYGFVDGERKWLWGIDKSEEWKLWLRYCDVHTEWSVETGT